MEVLDLFSAAAGGWSLGMHRAGFKTIAACENVAWRRALYQENNPDVLIYDDVCTLTADRIIRDTGRFPSVVVGSPPCQDISSANTKGKGVEGERSGLYFEAVRIIGEGRPRWFALENSSNLRTRGADAVLAALEALGYTCWTFVVRAGDIGANHERPRCWIIGCDITQVADADSGQQWGQPGRWSGQGWALPTNDENPYQSSDAPNPDGVGRHEGWSRRRRGFDVSLPEDTLNAAGLRHEGRRPWRHGEDGNGSPPTESGDAAHAHHHGKFRSSEHAEVGELQGLENHCGRNTGNASHPDQAGQADGCMVPGLRQEEISDDGCGSGRSDDGPITRQVAICAGDSFDPATWRADWSLDDLAAHLQLDDGLSSWLAGTRIAVGGPRGTSAASLIVEAFGDAVVPQIPEAIGNAIMRTERALYAIYGRSA